jgi:hypothetical protein
MHSIDRFGKDFSSNHLSLLFQGLKSGIDERRKTLEFIGIFA